MTLDGFFPYYCQDFDRTWLHIWVTRGCFIGSRNWSPFASTGIHPRYFWWGLCCSSC
jgi:hypothetical protein